VIDPLRDLEYLAANTIAFWRLMRPLKKSLFLFEVAPSLILKKRVVELEPLIRLGT